MLKNRLFNVDSLWHSMNLKGHSGADYTICFLCSFKSEYIWYNFTMKMILIQAAVI